MNQPMTFMWNNETAEMAKLAQQAVQRNRRLRGRNRFCGVHLRERWQPVPGARTEPGFQRLKANFLRINFLGKDGQPDFRHGAGISADVGRPGQTGATAAGTGPKRHRIELARRWLAKGGPVPPERCSTPKTTAATATSSVRHVFQPGTRKTYAEHAENAPAEAIAALELSMKDKDDRIHGRRAVLWTTQYPTWRQPLCKSDWRRTAQSRLQQTAVIHRPTLTTISHLRRSVFRSLLTLSMRYDTRTGRNQGWRGAPFPGSKRKTDGCCRG